MNSFLVISLAVVALVGGIQAVNIKDCGSIDGTVVSTKVNGCSDSDERCVFHAGTDAGITVKFDSRVDSSKATTKLWGVIADVPIPFPAIHPDACKDGGVHCPITKGSHQELNVQMKVEQSYPKVELVVRVGLEDSDGKLVLCQEIPAVIKA
ncbi:NPC intracellular cholesterol transporter 2 homolog a-like [Oppia nitens]|uniref:NPC intracellular cholesterol transporter 2 homolog a-like n=1 Tax=Oppia nitens TaxID=1686743 RepID=UPI0023DA3D64|nr:NPC intracellular cholesterol transporter 2 homolog a-like [Oppia nitens]